jgi:hypothetical protein
MGSPRWVGLSRSPHTLPGGRERGAVRRRSGSRSSGGGLFARPAPPRIGQERWEQEQWEQEQWEQEQWEQERWEQGRWEQEQ